MISTFRRTLYTATATCARTFSSKSAVIGSQSALALEIKLMRMFSQASNSGKTKAASGSSTQGTGKTSDKAGEQGSETVEAGSGETSEQEIVLKTEIPRRVIENLGEIDNALQELRNYERADILRTFDFSTRVAPILKKLTELGLSIEEQTKIASKSPLSLTKRDEKIEGSLDVLVLEGILRSQYNITDKEDYKNILTQTPEVLEKNASDLQSSIEFRAQLFKLEKVAFGCLPLEPCELVDRQESSLHVRQLAT